MGALATECGVVQTLFDPDDEPSPDPAGRSFDGRPDPCAEPARSLPSLRGESGGGPRLDDLVAGLWEGLAARRVVRCPVCASEMQPAYGAHALPIGGRCRACGSTLT